VKAGNGVAVPYCAGADTYVTSLTLRLPVPKSNHHWDIGETTRTGLVRVRFVIGCKVRILLVFSEWPIDNNVGYIFIG
jgi:hypothetical protein